MAWLTAERKSMCHESRIDLFFESLMNWAITGRICEDMYFTIRHYCFRIIAAIKPSWLPLIRDAEQQLKPHNGRLCPQYTWIERLGEGWKWPTLVFMLPVLITAATAAVLDLPLLIHAGAGVSENASVTLTGHLRTIATVLGTLSGLLLTVVVLTINVRTSNLAGADFLLNAVIRRRGFLPAAAFLLGTVFTALAGALVSNRVGLRFLNDWAVVTALLGLVCLFILLSLLRKTMQTLGTPELEQLLSAELLSQLRKSFRGAWRQALVQTEFSKRLEPLGFARYTATEKEEGHETEYRLSRLGMVIAIDLGSLKRISRLLKLAPLRPGRNTASIFAYTPDDAAAYLTLQPSGRVTKDTRLALLTKEHTPSKRIMRLIQNAFVVGTPSEPDLPWQYLRQLIYSATNKHESTTIKAVAHALDDILDDYLEIQFAVAGHSNMLLEDLIGKVVYGFKPPHCSELRLSDLAADAAGSRSADCLDELLNCICKLATRAFHRQSEKYFRDWVFQLCRAYYSAAWRVKGIDLEIAPDISRRMNWLSDLLSSEFHHHAKSVGWILKLSPYAISYLSFCLHMLRTSAERSDASTFNAAALHVERFLDDMLELHYTPDKELLLAYDKIRDYKNLVYVVAGAWLMHKIKGKELQAENLAPFMKKLIDSVPDYPSLLNLYAMPGMAGANTDPRGPLGSGDWDWPYSPYPQPKSGTEFQRWIRPYYQFLLLRKAAESPPGRIDLCDIRHTPGADHDSLKRFLTEIADEKYVLPSECQGASWGMDAKELESAKAGIQKLGVSWSSEPGTA